jgi:hypothetical protein
MTPDRLERFPSVWCGTCEKVQPMIFDVLPADDKNDHAAARTLFAASANRSSPHFTPHGLSDVSQLILKRASASRPSGEWDDDDYDVVADGVVVGRIMETAAAPVGQPWMWTLAFGHHEDRTPTHGYAETREAAMAAFAKSWRRL